MKFLFFSKSSQENCLLLFIPINKLMLFMKIVKGRRCVAGVNQCRQFLTSGGQELEESVRRGDVYALMIQHYIKNTNYLEAKHLLGELRQVLKVSESTPITYYVNKELIEALARGLGVSPATLVPSVPKRIVSDEGGIAEQEIEEVVE